MKKITPNIFVNNLEETIDFYKNIGFTTVATVPEDKDFIFAIMVCGEVTFMFQTFKSLNNELPEISRQNGGSLLLYIDVNDVNKLYNDIKDKISILIEPKTTFYNTLEFSILDNNGFILTFAQDV